MFGRWVDDELGGLDVSVQSKQRSYSRSPRAEAAALQDIGLLRAWNTNAISDGANRSDLTNRPHDYQYVGWLGVGGGGCLQQSAGEVLLLLFWGEEKMRLLANYGLQNPIVRGA